MNICIEARKIEECLKFGILHPTFDRRRGASLSYPRWTIGRERSSKVATLLVLFFSFEDIEEGLSYTAINRLATSTVGKQRLDSKSSLDVYHQDACATQYTGEGSR